MRVAILASGKSLLLYPGRSRFDCIIAVNREATHHAADWWSVGDAEVYWKYAAQVHNTPTIWTHEDTLRRIQRRASSAIKFLTYRRSERDGWTLFSATAALKLALALGADRVDCFGVDMAGKNNWDGTDEAGADRTESRWSRESAIWNAIPCVGVEVIRHGPVR